eukprot:TRINITY_DN7652_c0_g1_i1.p1 TRINITY_DN7652_c0_g1~~TRINITY_DN7652_c0_g1_i1.p1  ORF type:complete len:202 (-),score=26.03 TRINITY_DN7652_c0_g1_i1:121-726(-)
MKILGLLFMKYVPGGKPPILLLSLYEVSAFGYFQRGSVREVCLFVAREVIQRSAPGELQGVQHKEYICYSRVTAEGLGVVAVADEEYPKRVAFDFLRKASELFTSKQSLDSWSKIDKDTNFTVPGMQELFNQYQNPKEADKIMKIQSDIDETKNVLLKSIDNLLERGQKLEDLAQKSNDLSFQSKAFVNQAEKMNKCCIIL